MRVQAREFFRPCDAKRCGEGAYLGLYLGGGGWGMKPQPVGALAFALCGGGGGMGEGW